MFADVTAREFRSLILTSQILLFENINWIELYWVNQGPVIFRTRIEKDKNEKFKLYINSLPPFIKLNKRLEDNIQKLVQINQNLIKIDERLRKLILK